MVTDGLPHLFPVSRLSRIMPDMPFPRPGNRVFNNSKSPYIKNRDYPIIVGASPYFIDRGIDDDKEILIDAFNKYGDKIMAISMLNSKNEEYKKIAKEWAKKKGYAIKTYYY